MKMTGYLYRLQTLYVLAKEKHMKYDQWAPAWLFYGHHL